MTQRMMKEDPWVDFESDLVMMWRCCVMLRGMAFIAPGCPTLFSVWAPIAQRALAAVEPAPFGLPAEIVPPVVPAAIAVGASSAAVPAAAEAK